MIHPPVAALFLASGRGPCPPVSPPAEAPATIWSVADNKKNHYVDNGWPVLSDGDDHAVSELATDRTGALSPFGDVTFPLPAEELPFIQSATVVNR